MGEVNLTDALRELLFAADLSDAVLEEIAKFSRLASLPAGSVLFREGEVNRWAFLVRAGLVALEMNVPPHGMIRVLTLGPGELLAWSALLGRANMNASAVAISDVELIELDAGALRLRFAEHPQAGYEIMQQVAAAVSKRLVATRLQLLDVYRGESPRIPEASHVD